MRWAYQSVQANLSISFSGNSDWFRNRLLTFAGSEDSVSLELLVVHLWSLRMKPTAEERANVSGRIQILTT